MFHYTVSTSKGLEEAIEALEQNLKEVKFGVLWKLDLRGKLKEKGVDFNQPYFILEVCNPQEAAKVLNINELTGYFLPCKITVYESEGTTKIGLAKPSILVGMLENDDLKAVAEEIEKTLIGVLDKTK